MEEIPNFQLFPSQNSDFDNKQRDEIEQKAQAKKTPTEQQLSGEWKSSRNGVRREKLQWMSKQQVQQTWVKFCKTSLLIEVKTEKG